MVGVNTPARRLGGAALSLWWTGLMSLKIGNKTEIAIDMYALILNLFVLGQQILFQSVPLH